MLRIVLIALVVIVALIVTATLLLRREPPRIPLDRDHVELRQEAHCLSCHGPGEKNPRKPTHPSANDCFRCHVYKEAA